MLGDAALAAAAAAARVSIQEAHRELEDLPSEAHFPSPPAPTPPLLLLQNSRRVLAVPRVVLALGFVHGGHKMASGSTEQRAS